MPPDASLSRGAVFYMPHRNLSSPLPHYLIILNVSPETDDVVVLSVISSQIGNCRRRAKMRNYAEGTLVECSSEDYPLLTKPSVIDCNACLIAKAHLFRQDLKTATRSWNVPQKLLARILEGVRLSNPKPGIRKLLGLD